MQDLLLLGIDILTALKYLHEVGVVHRDIRLANCVQLSKKFFMLIDLEGAAEADRKPPEGFRFTDWTPATLEDGKYTRKSDVKAVGSMLLKSSGGLEMTAEVNTFLSNLQSGCYSAVEALNSAVLQNCKR